MRSLFTAFNAIIIRVFALPFFNLPPFQSFGVGACEISAWWGVDTRWTHPTGRLVRVESASRDAITVAARSRLMRLLVLVLCAFTVNFGRWKRGLFLNLHGRSCARAPFSRRSALQVTSAANSPPPMDSACFILLLAIPGCLWLGDSTRRYGRRRITRTVLTS